LRRAAPSISSDVGASAGALANRHFSLPSRFDIPATWRRSGRQRKILNMTTRQRITGGCGRVAGLLQKRRQAATVATGDGDIGLARRRDLRGALCLAGGGVPRLQPVITGGNDGAASPLSGRRRILGIRAGGRTYPGRRWSGGRGENFFCVTGHRLSRRSTASMALVTAALPLFGACCAVGR